MRAAIFLVSATIGLLVAKFSLDDMSIDASSFIGVVLIFAVLQSVLAPSIAKMTARNAPAILGATGLISTFIVWLTTMAATLLLPLILVKLGVQRARERRSGSL